MAVQVTPTGFIQSDQNAASYNYGQLPPDQALEEQALNRRQHIANLLIQQGLGQSGANHGQMVGRFYVPGSPLQNLAGIAQIAAGMYGSSKNDEARQALQEQSNNALAEAVARYKSQTSDVPGVAASPGMGASAAPLQAENAPATEPQAQAIPVSNPAPAPTPGFSGNYAMGPDESGWAPKGPIQDLNAEASPREKVAAAMVPESGPAPTQGPMTPGSPARARTPEERKQALIDLMSSQHPQAANLGRLLAQQQGVEQEHAAQREFQANEGALNREARLQATEGQLNQAMMFGLITKDQKDQMMAMQKQDMDQRAALKKAEMQKDRDLAAQHNETLKAIASTKQEGKGDFKEKANYQAGLKEVAKDDAMATQADQLETSLNRWDELNKTVPTGRIIGNRPAMGQPDFQELVRLENQLAMSNFKPGQGQISNFERQLVKGAGPSTLNDPEANANITQIMRGGIQNMRDKAAFKEWYLETNGKLLGADQKWNDYVENNPRYIQDKKGAIVPNPDRQDWMTHFAGGGAAKGAQAKPTTPAAGPSTAPAKIGSDAEYNALPSGAIFIGPDGKQRKKP